MTTRIRHNVTATEIPVVQTEPVTVDPKLFGFQGTYDAKRMSLLNWVTTRPERARADVPPAEDLRAERPRHHA